MPTVETNGIDTYYEEYGDGPPIVFLHGANSDHQLWAEQARPLADEYTVVVYDLRGHGRTGGSDHDAYTVDLYAADLAALVESLELDRPAICGLSLGGMIGYTFAADYPDHLSTLITLGASTPRTFSVSERIQRVYLLRVALPFMGNERVVRGLLWVLERIYGEDATADLDEIERVRDAHHCTVPDQPASEQSKLGPGILEYLRSSLDRRSISVPTLVLYGEHEPFVPAHAEYLATHLPSCRAEEIPDASHNSHVDNPAYVTDAIREFLDAHYRDPEAKATG